jgi:hypothetical protein
VCGDRERNHAIMQQRLISTARRSLRAYNQARRRITERKLYRQAQALSRKPTDQFDDILTFCMFLGHGRSGSTLLGRLLDAHPEALIAHELDVLRYIDSGANDQLLYHLLQLKSEQFIQQGNEWSGYSYRVSSQWQGRYRRLQVIGDKRTGNTLRHLAGKPASLAQLRSTIDPSIQLKFIHLIRNPFDNISTMARRNRANNLAPFIEKYFTNCKTIVGFENRPEVGGLIRVRLEGFIADPRQYLIRLGEFLGLEMPEDYLEDSEAVVFPYPKKTRYVVTWTREWIEQVDAQINEYDFLQGYSFED